MTPLQLFLSGLALAVMALALSVLAANPRSTAHRHFALAAMMIAGWTLGISGRLSGSGIEMWLRLSFACASLIPPAVLAFAQAYPAPGRRASALPLRLSVACGAAFAALSLSTRLLFLEPVMTPTGLSRKAGPLYPVFAVYFLVAWAVAMAVLARKTMEARGPTRARLQYLTAAAAITSAGAITTNLLLPLLTGRSSYTWLGPCFGTVFVALTGHAIIRHRLMEVKLVVHRGLILALAAAASLVPVALVILWFWPSLAKGDETERWLFLLALLGGSLLVPHAHEAARQLLDRYVYRARTDYQATVQEISKALTRVLDRTTLLDFLVTRLRGIVQPDGLAIYLFEDRSDAVLTRSGPDDSFRVPETMPGPIRQALLADRDMILTRATRDLLADLGWALVLPLVADDVVIGAIVMGPKLSGDPYDPKDLALLRTLANQAVIAVKNAQLYAEVVLANEYIENIVATINSGVLAVNAAGRITLFNRAAEHLTGLRADLVRLQPASVLPACLGEPLTRAVAGGRAITCPDIALTDGVTARSIICTVSPLRDTAGAILGGVAVFSDLTPLKELEDERGRAEKLAYLETLASGLAHEIKNPLVSIKTFVQLIPLRLDDARWLEDFSRLVEREIERIERLLDQLTTLSRVSTRRQRLLDLRLPLQEALELVQPALAAKRIDVSARLGDREPIVLGDHDEIKQLAHNLLINALEHTPPEGTVSMKLAAMDDHVTLTVADSGPGIPPELVERIFDPFFTTRRHGTGLGLAICMGIAAAHRARIRVANGSTHGATFTVDFPVVAAVPTA